MLAKAIRGKKQHENLLTRSVQFSISSNSLQHVACSNKRSCFCEHCSYEDNAGCLSHCRGCWILSFALSSKVAKLNSIRESKQECPFILTLPVGGEVNRNSSSKRWTSLKTLNLCYPLLMTSHILIFTGSKLLAILHDTTKKVPALLAATLIAL